MRGARQRVEEAVCALAGSGPPIRPRELGPLLLVCRGLCECCLPFFTLGTAFLVSEFLSHPTLFLSPREDDCDNDAENAV